MLRETCKRARGWAAHGTVPVTLSVYVSPIQFAEPDFVRHVFMALEATGFPAHRLQLEVTEGLLLDPTPDSLRKMDALVDAGAFISNVLGRAPVSRAGKALLAKREKTA